MKVTPVIGNGLKFGNIGCLPFRNFGSKSNGTVIFRKIPSESVDYL